MIALLCILLAALLSVRLFRAAVGSHYTKQNQFWLEIVEAVATVLTCVLYIAVAAPLLICFRSFFSPTLTYGEAIALLGAVPLATLVWGSVWDDGLSSSSLKSWIGSVVIFVVCVAVTLFGLAHLVWAEVHANMLCWVILAIVSMFMMAVLDGAARAVAGRMVRLCARIMCRFGYGRKAALAAIADLVSLIDETSTLPQSPEYLRLNMRARLSEFRGEVIRAREKVRLYDWSHAEYIARENLRDLRLMRRMVHTDEPCSLRGESGECDCYSN